MSDTPKISIIVSNYNSSDLINGTIDTILSTVGDLLFEVFIVDDVSTDGGLSLVDEKYKSDKRIIFVQCEKHVGYSALNVVLDRTRGEYLMTLDTDARLWPGALLALVDFLDKNEKAGAVTASLFYEDGSPQNYHRRLMTPMHSFFTTVLGRVIDKYFLALRNYKSYHYDDFDNTRVFEIEQPPTACFMFRKAALGSFIVDPDFNQVFLDVDLCRRIYDRGFKIYLVPNARVTHFKSVAANKKPNFWRDRQYYRDQLIYFKKHYPLHAPLMSCLLWLDRIMRRVLIYMTGRAPMR